MPQLAGRQLPLSLLIGLLQLLHLSRNSDPKFFTATRLQILAYPDRTRHRAIHGNAPALHAPYRTTLPWAHNIAQPSLGHNCAEKSDAFPGASNTQTDSVRLTKQPRHYPQFFLVCCRFMCFCLLLILLWEYPLLVV